MEIVDNGQDLFNWESAVGEFASSLEQEVTADVIGQARYAQGLVHGQEMAWNRLVGLAMRTVKADAERATDAGRRVAGRLLKELDVACRHVAFRGVWNSEAGSTFDSVFFLPSDVMEDDRILDAYRIAGEVKREVDTEEFEFEYSFVVSDSDINREILYTDGYSVVPQVDPV